MSQNIRAAVFDIDGTLYDYKTHQVLPSSVEAIDRLRRKGIRIIIASGRSYALLGDSVKRMVRPDYYVMANGHEILDRDGNPILLVRFTPEQAERIARVASERGMYMMLKYHRFSCIYSGWSEMQAVFGETGLDEKTFRYCPEGDYHRRELPMGFTLEGTDRLREHLSGLGDDLRVEYFFEPSKCDIFLRGVSKLSGLKEVLNREKIVLGDCIAFGDSGNDVDVLRHVGTGVAMGNASEDAKAAARRVCACSWEDGIAGCLRQLRLA